MAIALLALITFAVLIIWIVAHVVNTIMNYQDMQYFKERAREGELDKDTKDMVNFVNKHSNPSPFNTRNYYGNLK